MSTAIVVFLESEADVLRKPSLEGLAAARAMASALGGLVVGVLIGATEGAVAAGAAAGADEILALGTGESVPLLRRAQALAAAATKCAAAYVLVPATATGAICSRSARGYLGAGVAAERTRVDVTRHRGEDHAAGLCRQGAAGRRREAHPVCIGLRPNAFAPPEPKWRGDAGRPAPAPAERAGPPRGAKRRRSGGVDLTEAAIVVSGGRGAEGPGELPPGREPRGRPRRVVGASRPSSTPGAARTRSRSGRREDGLSEL